MNFFGTFFLRKRTLILKVLLVLIALWLIVVVLRSNRATRKYIGTPVIKYEDPKAEAKPLKIAKQISEEMKNESCGTNFSNAAPGSHSAPGEMGKPVVLPKNITEETKAAVAEGWKKYAFNQYVSDLISIRRKLPDPRHELCKQPGQYLNDLPQTSVVIYFHNEAWSVLLRTVHSVLERSTVHLIKEIILVDDYSDMPHLMQQLDDYMSSLPKVKIVRATHRVGFGRAMRLGLRYVTAPVLTYLDSHCECTEGWLEPLLDRIARDNTTVVCPVIDNIDDNTFEYIYNRDFRSFVSVGGFDWNLQINWHYPPIGECARHQHTAEPIWSPTIAGGLFAIDKEFFERLGTYDTGFDIWGGGENFELSIKSWMCGGTIEIVPCSHVGRILIRKRSQYKGKTGVDVLKKNYVRLAEVWLGNYAKYYYQRVGNDTGDFGNISGRVALREKLGCKSFEWYLKNIYPELFIPDESVAHGEYWMYSKGGEIRRDGKCLDFSRKYVLLYPCHGNKGNQLWIYKFRTKRLEHTCSSKCLAVSRDQDKITMETCNEEEKNTRQMWIMENFDADKFDPEYLWLY